MSAQSQIAAPYFPHRHKSDGSYDSICSKCFITVATVKSEVELLAYEMKHECNEPWLATED